jgi:hypothetical protein
VALVRGDLVTAAGANPVVFVLAACAVAVGPLVGLRALGALRPPAPWPAARRRRTERVMYLLVAASWLFQLHRLGITEPPVGSYIP